MGRLRSSVVLAALVAAASLRIATVAHAQAGTSSANHYSAYERHAILAALRDHKTSIDPSPEGKTLEGIDIVRLDVFEEHDPLPSPDFMDDLASELDLLRELVDDLHTTTKRYVIAREILLAPGEPYRQSLVDDSVRNLQTLPNLNFVVPQLSVVLAVPTKGRAPDGVRLLVITKDVWSLRPNWALQATNGGISLLTAQPAETNVAGTHTIANLNFVLKPDQLVLGAGYTNFRLDGSHIVLQPNANVVWNRALGSTEGSYGGLIAGQPLYSPRSEWAWDAAVTWVDDVQRRIEDLTIESYVDPKTKQTIPNAYRGTLYSTEYTATRSYGSEAAKHDFTLGLSLARSQYLVDAPFGASATTIRDFQNAFVPVSDNRVAPFAQYHTYEKRYVRLLDFETLGLQEDWRLGREAFVNLYPVTEALGSSRNFMGVDASLLYTVRLGDGLARATVESITEAQSSSLSDASIEPSLHIVSPTVVFGRFIYDAHLLYRYRNYLNQISYLGGDTRLRGYPTELFFGKDVASSNLEFRTHSLDILTAQVGLAAFYDIGDAFNGFSQLRPYDSVGVGLRGLFPQLDRSALRFDVGFPLGDGARIHGIAPVAFFLSLGQAFPVPVIGPGGGPGSPQLSGSPTTVLSPPP